MSIVEVGLKFSYQVQSHPVSTRWVTILELLAFNAQKFRGHVTLARPLFKKNLRGHVWTVPGNMCVKSEVRTVNHFGAIGI